MLMSNSMQLHRTSCLHLLLLIVLPITVSADDFSQMLDERRLFFTPQERMEALDAEAEKVTSGVSDELWTGGLTPRTTSGDSVNAEKSSVSVSLSRSLRAAASGKPVLHASDPFTLVFDGMVVGSRGVQLLVNGLPCRFMSRQPALSKKDILQVDCPAFESTDANLSLKLVSGRLQVSREHSVIALLEPGQSL